MTEVITYQTPSGEEIHLTPDQAAEFTERGTWPRNSRGEEFCTVSHGLHDGEPHVECFSSDGWSLHAPGSTDGEIATGDAPVIYSGEWTR